MTTAEDIERFVADLAAADARELFNQYAVEVPGRDRPGGAAIRCANLRRYLEPLVGAELALIGEAPSAHGARFSGIAFTSEASLGPAWRTSVRSLEGRPLEEYSAVVLAGALRGAGFDPARVLLWNAVPFHPARRDDPMRNRHPRKGERQMGREWLDRFLDLMRPVTVAAVGAYAARALPGRPVLRHPAHGGRMKLEVGLTALRHPSS